MVGLVVLVFSIPGSGFFPEEQTRGVLTGFATGVTGQSFGLLE
jgi:hypothetical protein